MKNALVLILLVFSGCQLFESSDAENIDPDLFGDWYTINTLSSSGISPLNLRVRGWSISPEGKLNTLGVVDSTGGLAIFDSGYQTKILHANNGKMTVEYYGHPDVAEDEVEYRITSDQLIIENGFGFINGTFQRSQVGNEVIPPMPSNLYVEIDGTEAENVHIAHQIPTAYVSQTSESELRLSASLEGKWIMISIDNYDGPGTYTIGKGQAEYQIIGSDWIQPFQTLVDTSGTIAINCDSNTSRCSGEFDFSTNDLQNEVDSEPVLENGSFDVPLLQ